MKRFFLAACLIFAFVLSVGAAPLCAADPVTRLGKRLADRRKHIEERRQKKPSDKPVKPAPKAPAKININISPRIVPLVTPGC